MSYPGRPEELYKLRDAPTGNQLKEINFSRDYVVRALATGEFRPPRAGEWFLSGAIVEAYFTPNDLSYSYHIAKLVRCKRTTLVLEEIC